MARNGGDAMASPFFNADAERELLVALVKERSAHKYIARLSPDAFYDDVHKAIFRAMQEAAISQKPITIPTISDSLIHLFGNDEHMQAYIGMCADYPIAPTYTIESNIGIIQDAAQRRSLYQTLDHACAALRDGKNDALNVMESVRQELRNMHTGRQSWKTTQDVLFAAFEAIEKRCKGEAPLMLSGIASLDQYAGGFQRGEMCVIGARPSVGKSALAEFIAINVDNAGHKVVFCSREMSPEQHGNRYMQRGGNVSSYKLRTGQLNDADWIEVTNAMNTFSHTHIDYSFAIQDIETLRSEVQEKVDRDGLDMLVVDYLQIVSSRRDFRNEYERISYVSRMLKEMTIDLGISVVALAQVGRTSEGSMPTLAELRGSGAIEQDADMILFMHKPKSADDPFVRPDDRGMFNGALESLGMEYIALDIAKNRQGITRTVSALFEPAKMKFHDINRGMNK